MKKMSFRLFGLPAAGTLALGYLIIGIIWISWSDKALRGLVPDPYLQDVFQTYKGWFYVFATALLLYVALKRVFGRVRKAQEQKAESEERFRILFEQAEDGIMLIGLNACIIDCNPAICRIFGVASKADVIGRSVLDFSPERQKGGRLSVDIVAELTDAFGAGKPQRFYWQHVQPSGAAVDVEVSVSVMKMGGGTQLQAIVRDITELTQAQDEVARERHRLKFIFDSLPIGICLNRMHPDGRETRLINDAHLRMAGIHREQDEPTTWFNISHPDDRSRHRALTEQIEKGEINRFTMDKRYVRTDGQIVWVMFCLQRRKMDDGGFEDLTAVVDITERKHTEKLLFRREQEFRALVENSQYLIARYNRDCQRIYVNPAYLEMAQMPRDQWIGTAPEFRSPLSPADAAVLQGILHRVLDGGAPESVDLPVTKGDNSKCWYHIHVVPEHGPEGGVESALLTAHDITERKRAEERLMESEARFRGLVTQAGDAFFLHDRKGRILDVNPNACSSLGYTREELLSMTVSDIDVMVGVNRSKEQIWDALQPGKPVTFEGLHCRKDGSTFPVEVRLGMLELGNDKCLLGLARDITDRKQAEESIHKAALRLNEAQRIAHVGNWELDLANNVLTWSDEIFRIFEIDSDRFSATYEAFLNAIHPDDREAVRMAYENSLQTKAPYSIEHRLLFSDGRIKYVCEQCETVYEGDKPIRSIGTVQDITERKLTEKEIKQVQEDLQYILNNTHDVIFQIDLKGNYIFSNVAAEHMTGYPLERLLGMNMMELIAPEHQQMVAGRLQKRIAGELDETTYSFEIIHKSGRRVWVELETKGVFSAEGTLQAIQGVARDVTERKRMEDALEKRIVALTRPFDQVDDLVFEDLFDVEEIQRIQDQFAAATNVASGIIRPDGSPITKPTNFTRLCGDVVRKTEAGCANCRKSDLFLGRYHPEGPVVQPCLSGGLWDAGVSIVVGGKHVASWLIGQVRDETQTEENMRAYARDIGVDEKEFMEAFEEVPQMSREHFEQISEALHSLVKQLSTTAYMNMQQARFIADEKKRTDELLHLSTAINQSAETVVISDAKGIIQYVNPAFEKTSGYTRDEVVGQNPRILKSEIHSEAFFKDMWGTILAGQPWNGQIHNQRKEGSPYVVDATISPILSQTGEVVNFVGVMRDITKELSLEEQFRHSQKMEAVGRLASGVAHDFNNILQTILGFCGVLLLESAGQDALQQDVLEIQNAAKRAGGLTRQLLAFGRRQPFMKEQIDLNLVLAEQTNMLCRLLGENLSLDFDPSEKLGCVKADRSQLEQVIMNLVVNARDAMPHGGAIKICTDNVIFNEDEIMIQTSNREFVCLSVTDTGMGMNEEVLDHIFEPFFTTKPVGEGTGLGLSVIYGIVDQHGGWIEVKSKPGEGTTFKVYLPRSIGEKGHVQPTDDQSYILSQSYGNRQKSILLVEDDPQVRRLASLVLAEAGYAVKDADSAEAAAVAFEKDGGRFDLLLIDAVLPDLAGTDLADELNSQKAGIPVIIFSGYADERIRMGLIEERGYNFLRKPFSTESLLNIVQSVLSRRAIRYR